MLKKIIFKILPKKTQQYLLGIRGFNEDIERYNKHVIFGENTQKRLVGRMILKYHVIEKGLTMPEMRPGFGKVVIEEIIKLCNKYRVLNYDLSDVHFVHSVKILNEYLEVNKQINFSIDPVIVKDIEELSTFTKIEDRGKQSLITSKDFFAYSHSDFKDFCVSRHSIRNFSDKPVDIDVIKRAITLAQKSPSSCNRQPNRVYVVENLEKIKIILDAQKGNRGFGQLINKVIILSSEISVFSGYAERNEGFINSGLFAMSLLYGLHYYEIGALPLAYIAVSASDDKIIREICGVPDSEVLTMFIGCGHVKDEFHYASSIRYSSELITKVIK